MELQDSPAMNIKRNILQFILDNGKVMSLLNRRLSDFLHIHSIVCREDMSLMVNFSINGMKQDITVTVRDDSITDDGSRICLRKAGSSVPGIDNALAEFVQGRRIPIPEKYASTLVRIKRFLL
ncbi:hypothetical protein [Mailhella massiliensis]|uniref:hypothetical protein n=1 Tax=Mailhella massiliensis TaxID=1903261 RepID=UPI00097CEC10|nr:hypothetical protein [Mailhella massiliensis]